MQRIKVYLEGLEEWALEHDLHIYASVLAIVAMSVLGWMLYTEVDKSHSLRQQNITLMTSNLEKDRVIYLLNAELELSKLSVPINETKPVPETVEKVSSRLNSKIDKVQNVLLDTTSTPTKVITKTQVQTQTVEKTVPVDSELKSMMRESFCNNFPADKTCNKVKK